MPLQCALELAYLARMDIYAARPEIERMLAMMAPAEELAWRFVLVETYPQCRDGSWRNRLDTLVESLSPRVIRSAEARAREIRAQLESPD